MCNVLDVGVCGYRAWKRRGTTDSKHTQPVADNLLARNFTPTAPNRVWTSDITYLWTEEGWLYLAVVLELFNCEVVGWSIKPRMTADLVNDALVASMPARRSRRSSRNTV